MSLRIVIKKLFARFESEAELGFQLGPVSTRPPLDTLPRKALILMFTLRDTEQVTLTIQPRDAAGNPTTLPSPPVWTSSDPTILTVSPQGNGGGAVVAATGKLGQAQVTCTATLPAHGGGTRTAIGTLPFTIVAGDASAIDITPGVAEPLGGTPTPGPAPTPTPDVTPTPTPAPGPTPAP